MNFKRVTIVIPTYNESLSIEQTITKTFLYLETCHLYEIDILVFDSASSDHTAEIVKSLMPLYPNLHLREEEAKSGLGSAYLKAMKIAITELKAEVVIEFDADLSHNPKYIEPILDKLQNCDSVVGSRYVKNGSIPKEWPFYRRFLSQCGNFVARLFFTRKYKDFTSGFRATKVSFLKKILPEEKFISNNYAYKLELFWRLHKAGAKIAEYPIVFIDREKGESKLPKNSIYDSLRVIFILRLEDFSRYLKMCVVGAFGLVLQFAIFNALRIVCSPFKASQLSVLVAIISNYIFNRKFTFNYKLQHKSKSLSRFLRFGLYSIAMMLFQGYVMHFGVLFFGKGFIQENLLLFAIIAIGSLINYYFYSKHIWPSKKLEHYE